MRTVKRVMIFLAITYAALMLALVLMETSLVYPAPKFPAGNWNPSFEHQDVEFAAADGVKLHAWLIPNPTPRETPRHILYCHGNGENVAYTASFLAPTLVGDLGADVMIFDYRGYGKSEGSPFEAGIKLDAEKALGVFCERRGIQPKDVILMGSSLGGGVATHLAATKGCKALVLQKTFSSLPDVAASKYPMFPIRLLMRNRFNSAKAIQDYDGPLFMAQGNQDGLIPIRFGKKLYANKPANDLNRFVELDGFGHNDGFPQGYWKQLDDWLSQVESATEESATE